MFDTNNILRKAKYSAFYRWLLNWGLYRMVPFNKPHGFRVVEIDDYRLKTLMPYKRSNFNHIKGLHACGLATISEFATGFLLLNALGQKKYRMILQRLEVNYLYQGKMDATAEFTISKEWIEEKVANPLTKQDAVVVPCEVKVHDIKGNHLTTAVVHWQFKEWSKVKTKT